MNIERLQEIYDEEGRPGAQAFRFAVRRAGLDISETEAHGKLACNGIAYFHLLPTRQPLLLATLGRPIGVEYCSFVRMRLGGFPPSRWRCKMQLLGPIGKILLVLHLAGPMLIPPPWPLCRLLIGTCCTSSLIGTCCTSIPPPCWPPFRSSEISEYFIFCDIVILDGLTNQIG